MLIKASISALAVLAVVDAGPASAENIRDTLAQAYRYNPRLDAERANLRATDENVSQANAGFRPSINAEADVGQQTIEGTASGRFGGGGSRAGRMPASFPALAGTHSHGHSLCADGLACLLERRGERIDR